MHVLVHMLAFQAGLIREVSIPGEALDTIGTSKRAVLDLAFMYGQNDMQPVADRCSVSVGDVIEHESEYHVVMPSGFLTITEEAFETYRYLDDVERKRYVWENDRG